MIRALLAWFRARRRRIEEEAIAELEELRDLYRRQASAIQYEINRRRMRLR